MKVLMFGWEFPPHISGGLGTACEGLTWALSKDGVEIILVVPKLFGDEVAPFSMVNASDIPITSLGAVLNTAGQLTMVPDKSVDQYPVLALQVPATAENRPTKKELTTVISDSTDSNSIHSDEPGTKASQLQTSDVQILQTLPINTTARDSNGDLMGNNIKRQTFGISPRVVDGGHLIETIPVSSPLQPYSSLPQTLHDYSIYPEDRNSFPMVVGPSLTEQTSGSMNPRTAINSTSHSGQPEVNSRNDIGLSDLPVAQDKSHVTTKPLREKGSTYASDSLAPVRASVYKFSGRYDHDLLNEVKRFAEVAVEIARSRVFDVIHAHDWMTFDAGVAAKRLSGKPLVLHVHATEIDRSGASPDPRIYNREKAGLHACDHIIAVSQWTKQILIRHYGIDESKITAVHNGIMHAGNSVSTEKRSPLPAKIVSFVGRITYQKGPLYFVEAAFKVLEKFPNAHFVIAGSGDQLTRVIEQVSHLRMDSHFSFTGFLKGRDVDRLWSMTDVYVMPSVSEPFGITPLEAIRAGVPVIVSRQSGVSEVMPHAMKVDFWDTDALADAICSVLSYPVLANSLAQNAQHSLKTVTWERAARRVIEVYEKVERNS